MELMNKAGYSIRNAKQFLECLGNFQSAATAQDKEEQRRRIGMSLRLSHILQAGNWSDIEKDPMYPDVLSEALKAFESSFRQTYTKKKFGKDAIRSWNRTAKLKPYFESTMPLASCKQCLASLKDTDRALLLDALGYYRAQMEQRLEEPPKGAAIPFF